MKIYRISETLPDGKKFPGRHIVLRLQDDKKRTVFLHYNTLVGARCSAHVSTPTRVILIKIIQLRHQLSGADGSVSWVEDDRHVPWARVARASATDIEDGVRNSVTQYQSAKRVAHQHAMVDLLTWLPGGQRQFVNGSQATILRRYVPTRQLAVPKRQQIQTRHTKVLPAPRDINTDYVNPFLGHLGKTRDHINEVFKSANITGVGIVHPTVDINEKQGSLRLTNGIDCSRSL